MPWRAIVILAAAGGLYPMPHAQAADAGAGRAVFQSSCSICHSVQPGQNKVGPTLFGLVGRKTGIVAGYNYSPANQSANLTWDEATLDKYLEDTANHHSGDEDDVCGGEGRHQASRPDRLSRNHQIEDRNGGIPLRHDGGAQRMGFRYLSSCWPP